MEIKHSKESLKHMEKNRDTAYEEWLESVQSKSYQKVCRDIFYASEIPRRTGIQNLTTGDEILKKHKENRKSDDNKIKYQFDDLIPKPKRR